MTTELYSEDQNARRIKNISLTLSLYPYGVTQDYDPKFNLDTNLYPRQSRLGRA